MTACEIAGNAARKVPNDWLSCDCAHVEPRAARNAPQSLLLAPQVLHLGNLLQMSAIMACLLNEVLERPAEYLGGAITCDAYHMTDPRADGLGVSTCIELALKDAGIEKEQVCLPIQHQRWVLQRCACGGSYMHLTKSSTFQAKCQDD